MPHTHNHAVIKTRKFNRQAMLLDNNAQSEWRKPLTLWLLFVPGVSLFMISVFAVY